MPELMALVRALKTINRGLTQAEKATREILKDRAPKRTVPLVLMKMKKRH